MQGKEGGAEGANPLMVCTAGVEWEAEHLTGTRVPQELEDWNRAGHHKSREVAGSISRCTGPKVRVGRLKIFIKQVYVGKA